MASTDPSGVSRAKKFAEVLRNLGNSAMSFFSACLCAVSAAKLFMFITSCKLDSRFAV